MMSTGVDIPDLEYIVFLRPVKSRILFEQMLGRGTRKGERFTDKSHFVVFDCFDGSLLEYFRRATAITAERPERESRTILQVIEDIWANRDRDYNIRCLVKRLRRIEKEMSGEARPMFASYIPNGDMGSFATELPQRLRDGFTATMALLRDPKFQKLLLNYPRAPRTFVVAYETEDTVSSEWRVRGADGREYRPDDYLTAFSDFVRENPAHINAIRILLNRPRDWSIQALKELKSKLAATPEHFTIENLQKAHEIHYHKALVDVISMIKHAAHQESPLWTAEERVDLAFQKVTDGKTFTQGQEQWLNRIREHLKENLSLDQDDFDILPIFTRSGGWATANGAFEGQLPPLIHQFNEAIAS